MRKTLALAAVLLAACEAQVQTDAESLRSALPEESAVRIATPEPTVTSSAAEVIATAPIFGSEYARVTFWTAATVNAGVASSLARLRFVASLTPTSCDAVTCTWGPWTDHEGLNEWRLVARQDGAGWAYWLDARPGSTPLADFAPIVAGVAYSGAEPGRGNGSFLVDFDAAASLDQADGWVQEDFGRVEVRYDARSGCSIEATARGVRSRDPEDPVLMNAAYAYRATAAGGELQLALETLETPRNLSLRSRWDGTGAGRGDARWTADREYAASECWGDAASGFALLFDTDDPLSGDAGACAFRDPLYASVTPP